MPLIGGSETYDVAIVGGGPAGLSAALVLGRARRRVLVCDAGRPRNWASPALNGYLSRDGTAPLELLAIAREELARYPDVRLVEAVVEHVERTNRGFAVVLANGLGASARRVLLATGVVDELPAIAGFHDFYGTSIHHCPYCDGWEHRDEPIAVYGFRDKGARLALMLKQWSGDVALCTDGRPLPSAGRRRQLDQNGIGVYPRRIARLEGQDGRLECIAFADGTRLPRRALFFTTGQHQRSALVGKLGLKLEADGGIAVRLPSCSTSSPGVFAAGDAARIVQLLVFAAAEGAGAAIAINKALLAEDGIG